MTALIDYVPSLYGWSIYYQIITKYGYQLCALHPSLFMLVFHRWSIGRNDLTLYHNTKRTLAGYVWSNESGISRFMLINQMIRAIPSGEWCVISIFKYYATQLSVTGVDFHISMNISSHIHIPHTHYTDIMVWATIWLSCSTSQVLHNKTLPSSVSLFSTFRLY